MDGYQRDFGIENIIVDHAKYADRGRGGGQREFEGRDRESDAGFPGTPESGSFRKPEHDFSN